MAPSPPTHGTSETAPPAPRLTQPTATPPAAPKPSPSPSPTTKAPPTVTAPPPPSTPSRSPTPVGPIPGSWVTPSALADQGHPTATARSPPTHGIGATAAAAPPVLFQRPSTSMRPAGHSRSL